MTADPVSFEANALEARLPDFASLLHACVHDGASVGFVLPFTEEDAEVFWHGVLAAVRGGRRLLLVIEAEGRIVGTVQLDYDTPANQPHRAEARKLLVHPAYRRRGLARALMLDLERRARDLARSLVTLDTRSGDGAERLYRSMGYVTVGSIPGYCLDPFGPTLDATTIMYKAL